MEQMKTKRFALFLACILCITILVLLYGDLPVQPSIQNLVSETQTRITDWKAFKISKDVRKPDPEEKYLKQLGFLTDKPRLYPNTGWVNSSLPVFVTTVPPSDLQYILTFLKSFQHFFPNSVLFIYDLGLNPTDSSLISGICNNTSTCVLRTFDFDAYPSHVRNLQLYAYRPIIIQEVLNEAGAIVVIDVRFTLISGELHKLMSHAEKTGVISWTINQPTSALTHPRMFDYFHTQQEKFFFHRMVEPNHMILLNTEHIHFRLMFPWVKCALVPNCIAPIGAQNSGCRFDKKPLYRYTGCHRYDTSALNVVLGLMFDFSSSHYAAKEEDKFFHLIDFDKELPLDSEKNSTLFPDFMKL
ncbi:uncharacterized protein [Parasteatoda tepidariorum]|uniref:uncharacterized protein n=1 Tax=Parasteatoda tepidariorum TaxID=114398 RepID=UPI00077FA393|nr:uncharacterized protein LOC107446249 [Parasteatoda tepidariorum]